MSGVKPMIAGKRKINKSLKAWITFVKKVQKEEKLSYKDAIHRAKLRKDKGEKWMTGGENTSLSDDGDFQTVPLTTTPGETPGESPGETQGESPGEDGSLLGVVGQQMAAVEGGKRRRKTMRRTRGRGRTSRRARGRASRRH